MPVDVGVVPSNAVPEFLKRLDIGMSWQTCRLGILLARCKARLPYVCFCSGKGFIIGNKILWDGMWADDGSDCDETHRERSNMMPVEGKPQPSLTKGRAATPFTKSILFFSGGALWTRDAFTVSETARTTKGVLDFRGRQVRCY